MKRLFSFILLVLVQTLVYNTCFAQNKAMPKIFDTLIVVRYYEYYNYCTYDGKRVTVKPSPDDDKIQCLFVSDKLQLSAQQFFFNSKAAYCYDGSTLHIVDCKTGQQKNISSNSFETTDDTTRQILASLVLQGVTEQKCLFSYDFSLYVYDIATNRLSRLNTPTHKSRGDVYFFDKGNSGIFDAYSWDEEYSYDHELYMIDLTTNTPNSIPLDGYISINTDVTGNYLFIGDSVVDKNLKKVGNFLKTNELTQIGCNYVGDTLHSVNFIITWNDDKKSILAYRRTVELEQSLYDIYKNKPLNQNYLDRLGRWECNVLQQMVYAKHNYMFTDRYYLLLFSIFDFYNPNMNNKTDVESQFTNTDRQNLQLIQQQLQKK